MSTTTTNERLSSAQQLAHVVTATEAAAKAKPEITQIGYEAVTALVAGTTTEVNIFTGGHAFTIDEPAILAGTNRGASPVEHLLASLGSCQVITYQVWAAKLGIALEDVEVRVTGKLDVNGFFGFDPDTRPGFQAIDVAVRITGPESDERYAELTKFVDEHCPVLDVLTAGVPVGSTFSYN